MRVAVLLSLILIPLPVLAAGAAPVTGELVVSERAARALGLAPGDEVEIAAGPAMNKARRMRVTGVYTTPEHPSEVARRDLAVRLHLPDLEQLLGLDDRVDRIVVRLRNPARAEEIRDRINRVAYGYRAYTATELAGRTSRTFQVVSRFHRAIGIVTVLASATFLVAIMALKVEEMRRETGLLRLVGIAGGTILQAVLLVAALVAALGSAAGIAIGYGSAALINGYYRRVFETDLSFAIVTWPVIRQAVTLSVLLGLAAGALVGWRLLRRHPLEQVGR